MTYDEARDEFQNGDVVFFSAGKRNIVRRAICWFTRGKYYHVGIVFWVLADTGDARLMLAEAQPDGYRIVNLGFHNERNMCVFRDVVPWSAIGNTVLDRTGATDYSYMDLLYIGMHERFGVNIPAEASGSGDVCSVVTSKILQFGGARGIETMVSPQRLFEQLSAAGNIPVFFIRGSLAQSALTE